MNGVRVGYVKDIRLQGELKQDRSMDFLVQVTMEVMPNSLRAELERHAASARNSAQQLLTPEQYVDAGIRAKLAMESFVTGQLLVELDFQPNTQPAVSRAGERRASRNSDGAGGRATGARARADVLREDRGRGRRRDAR